MNPKIKLHWTPINLYRKAPPKPWRPSDWHAVHGPYYLEIICQAGIHFTYRISDVTDHLNIIGSGHGIKSSESAKREARENLENIVASLEK